LRLSIAKLNYFDSLKKQCLTMSISFATLRLMTLIEFFSSGNTQSALAEKIGVSPSFLNQWLTGARPIPEVRALEIERATNGVVTCEELRPDVDWRRWRDLTSTEATQ
jgi:DNA-binding transcriptional regulator YdaS (Cro superfamily)